MAESGQDEGTNEAGQSAKGGTAKPLLLVTAIVVAGVCAAGGYFVGSMLRSASAKTSAGGWEHEEAAEGGEKGGHGGGGEKSHPPPAPGDREYIELTPFTATLNTPRRDRFVSISVSLAIDPKNKKAVDELVTRKKPEIDSRITLYLSGRTLEDLSGEKNLNRLLRELQDLLNDYLWPQQRPLVETVLIKSLIIQ